MNKNLIEMTKKLNKAKTGNDSFTWAPNHIGKGLYCWAVMNADRGKYFAERERLCLGHFMGALGQNYWLLVK